MQALAVIRHSAYTSGMDECILFDYVLLQSGAKKTVAGWQTTTYSREDYPGHKDWGVRGGQVYQNRGYLFVIDIDSKNDKPGEASWDNFLADRPVPSTYEVRTPSGGRHLYFLSYEKLSSRPGLLEAVDLIADGMHVCAVGHSLGYVCTNEVEPAYFPYVEDIKQILGTGTGADKRRRTQTKIAEDVEFDLTRTAMEEFCKYLPDHMLAEPLSKLLAGQQIAGKGNRHEIIRASTTALIPQLMHAFGPGLSYNSLCELLTAEYPEGMTPDDHARTLDAWKSQKAKTDPQTAQETKETIAFLKSLEATAATELEEITEQLETDPDLLEPASFDDLRHSTLPEALRLATTVDKGGKIKEIKNTEYNRNRILETFWAGRLRFDVRDKVVHTKDEHGEWYEPAPEALWADVVTYFANRWGITAVRSIELRDAVTRIAKNTKYDAVQEYLDSLEWDGTPRVETFFEHVAGVEVNTLNRKKTLCFFVGAVARALAPGAKMDTQLIVQGKQGIGKSKMFAALVPNRTLFDDGGHRAGESEATFAMRLHRLWIWENSEMVTTTKDENARKAWLSACSDTFRAPYAHVPETHLRKFAVVGTTNDDTFLYDSTGSRRYHVLRATHAIDTAVVESLRDQLWAEAVHLFKNGAKWWMDADMDEKLNLENEQYRESVEDTDAQDLDAILSEPIDMRKELPPAAWQSHKPGGPVWCASRPQLSKWGNMSARRVSRAIKILEAKYGWVYRETIEKDGNRLKNGIRRK